MSKIHSKDDYLRQEKAFHLMSLSAIATSNTAFAKQVDSLGFKLLPDYSHGDLSKPRFCCTAVQNKENLKEVFLLNRGLPWEKMNFWGCLEELPDILAATRGKEPEDTHLLTKKLYDIRRDKDLEKITVIGHSRGALVVDHTADKVEIASSKYTSVLTLSAESPGVSWLNIQNPDYIQYISDFHSIINSCGTPSSPRPIAIQNTPQNITGREFVELGFELHGIQSLLDNFSSQAPLAPRPACFSYAYEDFINKGGKPSLQAAIAVKGGNMIKNMSAIPATMCNLLIDAIRPDSYAIKENDFWNGWNDLEGLAEVALTGLAIECLF
ncbi:MAG: hypothetical protein NWS20_04460 [Rickettsiaceae bacterium]|nr:hypothetical protein [Rickettsiaceae bacterium]MDP4832823.1 hypothetical protein [Rickettsiaceae bacterium]MDP5020792.1 hypothetical protein [Rickettsiaceae bacterium]MDP5083370.1 hypothetical protein [Rickettsiaceae bacterium]